MNSSNLYKRVRFVVNFFKPSGDLHSTSRKYLTSFSKPLTISEIKSSPIFAAFSKIPKRTLFSSNLTKSNDSDSKLNDNQGSIHNKAVFEDEDFQNILKDFAKDFGLNSDSTEMIDDMKKKIELSESHIKTETASNSDKLDSFGITPKFKDFSESDAITILSQEEPKPIEDDQAPLFSINQEFESDLPLHMKRGVSGVYDVDELVDVLHEENLKDIAVISVPKEIHYSNFLVLATAKSLRHSKAVTEYIIKLYKKKKEVSDPFIIVEGDKMSTWKAIDMGNIVLHIFLEDTRKFYDIESLWLFDPEFDSGGTLRPDPLFEAIKEQMSFFNSFQDENLKEDPNKMH